MKKDLSTQGTSSSWKSQLLGAFILIAMLAGLVYVNVFASMGMTLLVGVAVVFVLLLLKLVPKKQPDQQEDVDRESDSN